MKRLLICTLIFISLFSGCKITPTPREIVFVPDISQSIDKDSQQQMFAAIEDVAQHLHRGDTVAIIPITGNAVAELQGRTLRYAVPSAHDRKPYDADLRKLNEQIKDDLARLQADAVAHPGKRTDIIGSIWIAMKGFSDRQTDKRLIVLSDFIQDDDQFNFRKDRRLANEEDAATLGQSVVEPDGDYPTVKVVLGRLRSDEFSALPPGRQRAINAFWGEVMSPATVEPDGTAAVLRSSSTR